MSAKTSIATLGLVVLITACGAATGSPVVTAPAAASAAAAPQAVRDAFCDLLAARAGIEAGDVASSFHAAQLGELDNAITVSSDIILPATAAMAAALETMEPWEPAGRFVANAEPLVDEFGAAADAFVENPTQESFDRADAAGRALRDELFDGEFARIGPDLINAEC